MPRPTSPCRASRLIILGAFLLAATSLLASLRQIEPSALPNSIGVTAPSVPALTATQAPAASGTGASYLTFAAEVALLVALAIVVIRRKRRMPGRYFFWETAGALIGLAAFFLVGYSLEVLPQAPFNALQSTAPAVAMLMLAALIVLGGALALQAVAERRRAVRATAMAKAEDPVDTAKELIASLRKRLYSDRGGGIDRQSIVACYSAMTKLLQSHGARDRPSYTPRELRVTAGRALNISGSSIDDLTRLFERARYDALPVTHAEAIESVAALERITGDLEARLR